MATLPRAALAFIWRPTASFAAHDAGAARHRRGAGGYSLQPGGGWRNGHRAGGNYNKGITTRGTSYKLALLILDSRYDASATPRRPGCKVTT